MRDPATMQQESDTLRREIGTLEAQVRAVYEYIATQERNLRTAPESVRHLTERGLAEARTDLSLKEIRLQQLRQDLAERQVILAKHNEINRKQQDIQTLERERDRITQLLDQARADVQRLQTEYHAMTEQPSHATYALVFGGGERMPLAQSRGELLVGCADPGVFPDIDLTNMGGTTSGVSRKHAVLRFQNGGWNVIDLNSTNGTFVNAARLTPNLPTPLHDQAKLRFGGIDATFTVQPAANSKTTRLS